MRQRMGFDVIDGHGDQVLKTDVLADQETQIFKPKLPKGKTHQPSRLRDQVGLAFSDRNAGLELFQ